MIAEQEKVAIKQPIEQLFKHQQEFVKTLRTEPIANRKKRLNSLRAWVKANRANIQQAIYKDFRKPAVEVDATEIFPVLDEIKHTLGNLDRWSRPKKIDAPLTMIGTRANIVYEPKGVCLIIAPWNYPFNLSVGPLVSALASGNAVIIKPSELTPNTSALISRMCQETFDPREVTVVEGDATVSQQLLTLPFDHIFFTGSPAIGKVVMRAAAEHLTSVTLELGGKSPTVISSSAKVREAAQRVAVAKFINNGQTCIAPDYVLVHETVQAAFVTALKDQIQQLFAKGTTFQQSNDYARIVNAKHFQRLHSLVEDAITKGAKAELAGVQDAADNFIHPIILTQVPPDARIMDEEIFGPVLPVISYQSFDEVISLINSKPKPLALYYFGDRKAEKGRISQETSSGAICINDCAIHFLHHNIPFGGVNNSGIGKSHGYYGFQAFSNEKPVLKQRNGLTSVSGFYPPYTNFVKRMVDGLLKFF